MILSFHHVLCWPTKYNIRFKCAECNSYEQVSVSFDTIFQQVRNGTCKPYVSF